MKTTEIKQKTFELIDRLKAITVDKGLSGSGNEYIVMVETFLYKFLNDKFIYEAKQLNSDLAKSNDFYKTLEGFSENQYDILCDSMLNTVVLRKEHLIPNIAKRQNEDNFAEIFDATLETIASDNSEIFHIVNDDETRISVLQPLSVLITGGTAKRNEFCKALIGTISNFSFEEVFEAGYDFFSTIFEYLIKDYNANGGGSYAEYYTPHSVASIMANLLVDKEDDIKSVTCYDPSAGTGTLVIALAHAIGEQNCTVYTQDISDKSSTMMMLNLILNNMSHSLTHVVQGNTLRNPYHKEKDGSLKKFDYIVSNPPFNLDFSGYQSDLKNDTAHKGRFFAGIPNIPPKDKESMAIYLCFFQHLLYSMKDNGKAAIVVPTGFLTGSTPAILKKIRKYLVDNKILRGAVIMPSNIFANTNTNVSVIFIDKAGVETPTFIDASKLGVDVKEDGYQRTKLTEEEIDRIISTFKNKECVDDFSITPSFDEIKEKSYSFSAGQYFDIKIEYVDITAEQFKTEMNEFKATLKSQFEESHKLEEEIERQLNILNFGGK